MENMLSLPATIDCVRCFPIVTVLVYTVDSLPLATLVCSRGVLIESLPISYLQALHNHRLIPDIVARFVASQGYIDYPDNSLARTASAG